MMREILDLEDEAPIDGGGADLAMTAFIWSAVAWRPAGDPAATAAVDWLRYA